MPNRLRAAPIPSLIRLSERAICDELGYPARKDCRYHRIMPRFTWRTITLVATAFILGTIAAGSGSLSAAWTPMARLIGLQDPPIAASANVLSEHEIERLDTMSPQSQAELLLERAINHYRGANE